MTAAGLVVTWAVSVFSGISAPETGRICVAPLPKTARQADHDFKDGRPQRREPHYEFTVQLDEAEPVAVPLAGMPLLLSDVPTGEKHKVVIRDREETIESFFFTFESRGDSKLCLGYRPWYQTWSLEPPRPGASWCACEWEQD